MPLRRRMHTNADEREETRVGCALPAPLSLAINVKRPNSQKREAAGKKNEGHSTTITRSEEEGLLNNIASPSLFLFLSLVLLNWPWKMQKKLHKSSLLASHLRRLKKFSPEDVKEHLSTQNCLLSRRRPLFRGPLPNPHSAERFLLPGHKVTKPPTATNARGGGDQLCLAVLEQ